MKVNKYFPKPPLSEFVEYMWYLEDYRPLHSFERTLPDGSVDIIFDLCENPVHMYDSRNRLHTFKTGMLCGPHTDYYVIDTSGDTKVLGIHFKPGGLYPFQRYSMEELLNQHISLDTIWGREGELIYEELLHATSVSQMFELLEQRLYRLARIPLVRSPEVEYIHTRLRESTVQELVSGLSISHRTLIQRFKEQIGISPKRLTRMMRLQDVLSNIGNASGVIDWADLALMYGYYDQAHFIREFRAFSGIKPTDYEAIPGRHWNHVPADLRKK